VATVSPGPHLVCKSVEGTHHERFVDQGCVTADKFRENVALSGNAF